MAFRSNRRQMDGDNPCSFLWHQSAASFAPDAIPRMNAAKVTVKMTALEADAKDARWRKNISKERETNPLAKTKAMAPGICSGISRFATAQPDGGHV